MQRPNHASRFEGIAKTNLQASRASDTETLQSQVDKAGKKRLSLSGLEILHGSVRKGYLHCALDSANGIAAQIALSAGLHLRASPVVRLPRFNENLCGWEVRWFEPKEQRGRAGMKLLLQIIPAVVMLSSTAAAQTPLDDASCPSGSTIITSGDIQTAWDGVPFGGTLCLKGGTYSPAASITLAMLAICRESAREAVF